MNKIKIVDGQGFRTMKNCKKDFEVILQQNKQTGRSLKRPITPKQVFKYVEQESHFFHSKAAKTEKITSNDQRSHESINNYLSSYQSSASQRSKKREQKIQQAKKLQRIKTAKIHEREQKEIQDMMKLKKNIDCALAEIQWESLRKKKRMDLKYTAYNYKKFGKFWNPRINGLAQTSKKKIIS